jgi:hypothetical protein
LLNIPAPFPQVGAWALFNRGGESVAARIVGLTADGSVATLSFPDRPTSSGFATAAARDLIDPSPLDTAECEEMAALAAHLSGLAAPRRGKKAARYEALWLRDRRARRIVEQLRRINGTSLATGATREAQRVFAAAIAEAEKRIAA